LRTLLLSRSSAGRRTALEQLLQGYEKANQEILAEVVNFGEASKGSWWNPLRWRPFFGYRSACASLYRTVINYVLPEQADSSVKVQRRTENGTQRVRYVLRDDVMEGTEGGTVEDEENKVQDSAGQARALVVVLRQLATASAWELEKAAAIAHKETNSTADQWLARTPNLETPEYEVLLRDLQGSFEVRKYAPYSVVQTAGNSDSGSSGNQSFFTLAGYIFGKSNQEKERMAMTTPVQIERRTGTMSFIMPSKYWGEEALQSAPKPTEDAGVQLKSRPGELVAVSTFGGYARAKAVKERTEALLCSVGEREDIRVVDPTATRLMQYNDPFTVPWKRRNEVSVAVELV